MVFSKIPHVVGNSRVKYVRLDRDARSYKVKRALELLGRAGLVDHVYHSDLCSAASFAFDPSVDIPRRDNLF